MKRLPRRKPNHKKTFEVILPQCFNEVRDTPGIVFALSVWASFCAYEIFPDTGAYL